MLHLLQQKFPATVFNSSSQHLLITVDFTVQLLLVGSHSALFQLSQPWIRDILSLSALFYAILR